MSINKKSLLGAGAALMALMGLGITTFSGMEATTANPTSNQQAPRLIAQKLKNLRVIFPSRADSTDLQSKADAVAAFLSKEMGISVKAQIGDDTAAVEALRANRAEVAFLSSRPALKAEELANARLYLAEVRDNYSGRFTYNSVFVVRDNSAFKSGKNAKTTLEQLRGRRIAFTSPTSGSGFIFPVSELVKQGFVSDRDRLNVFFGQIAYGGNYSKALQALLRGQADVAVVSEYALLPPYITEEDRKQLRVLYGISGVPAHGIVIDDRVPAPDRERLINALLKLNQSSNNQLLRNLYNSTELVRVDHDRHLAPIRKALQRVGIEP
ncbi:phosphate/phosphite/phosphonate ABC transporter substrate-binding protein [Umezakia ovalisporum]|jgi:phosphonate transport system substrate-binding protein|uniref:Phosphate/phosphite/phosphonate ABC transporter substrate-binding protein n=2 Tax=Umezakia ovalisporum TaxID=75695 RepID=A0AA43H1J0_9CYAN|nr:phosphate/phosphite/phosphonate ABC transporter substrate-binding protein [Umezakia ovalisporum]MBI1242247.1 PhnD/SsuA/transferrin family substrate-binding protein [Nostoc sp. RI_552]MDH6057095.1 phosphate/phosphite/phosphonate ABC transporter substrate-binding protein [Umezakia ovalisporum FSS-43]MDH6065043.1 phosphate/phosphite/phosphonate ABC transporter substrate-binding protein [Umezakia ovalisporum FSS-62]MDH6067174.1 phosphate/phosphite/phosphonate ABC transporter substrate-binding pr